MLWAVWGSLAFVLLVAAGGGYVLVRRALATWRTFKTFTAFLAHVADTIGLRAEEASRKVDASGDAAARLTTAAAQLARSAAYARLIAGAAGGARAVAMGVRGAVPRK